MKMTYEAKGALGVVHVLEDRIDAAVAIAFKDEFRGLVAAGDGDVILNLASVDFLDSSGLGAVVAARKLLGGERQLELAGLTPTVDKVMTLTRMNTVFRIHSDIDAALGAHDRSAAR